MHSNSFINHREMANSRTAILVLALVVPFLVQISLAEDCGIQASGKLCAPGICCSEWGWCGITAGHCGAGCQSQCSGTPPSPPSPPPGAAECGIQAGGAFCSPGICCSRWGFCGITDEHCGEGCQSGCPGTPSPPPPPPSPPTPCGSGVAGIVSSSLFDQIFPKRDSFYTYEAFISAANSYAGFGTTGNCTTRKQELAAIFAQFTHETTGLIHIREIRQDIYCEESVQFPCAIGQKYFGRGPLQLSWNYNYKLFGDSIGVDLVKNPDLVATDPLISFKSAIWFWKTPQYSKPSCHDVMTDGWTPTPSDIASGRTATFGMTTLIINGGQECGANPPNKDGDKSRQIYYTSICGIFGISPGSGTSCANMTPFWLLWNVQ